MSSIFNILIVTLSGKVEFKCRRENDLDMARIKRFSDEADRKDYRAYNFALESYIVDETAAELPVNVEATARTLR